MHDIAAVFRQFRKAPAFAITVIATIALGIGANTAIFTLVHAVLLRSLPVSNPKMLYRLGSDNSQGGIGDGLPASGNISLLSYDLYKHLQEATPQFEQLAAVQSGSEQMNVRAGQQPAKSEPIEYVSGNYFVTLGVGAFAGRVLTSRDDVTGAPPAVVMSYAAWEAEYGSDPGVIGKTFTIQNHPVTIIGIAPAGFYGDRVSTTPPAFWIPLTLEATLEGSSSILLSPTSNWLYLLGRVKPHISLASLADQMTADMKHWLSMQPLYLRNGGAAIIARQRVVLLPGGGGIQQMQQQQGTGLYLLLAISGLVLLVACANVANLLLARGAAHRADTSLRMALGAARSRIVRQMLTQSLVLAVLGGLAGVAIAYAGTRTILSVAFPDAPQLPIHPNPSLPVLGFALLLSLATGVIFGVVPAWTTSKADPAEALRGANRSTRDRASLSQRSLIVFQAALSLTLLVAAGLLTRSLAHLQDQDFGVQTANRYVVHFDPAGAGYTVATLPPLYQALQDRFGALPDVANVGLALYSPLEQQEWTLGVAVPGHPSTTNSSANFADFDRVSPAFFAAVGEPVVRGRSFTDQDSPTSQNVAIVNEAFVRKFFPAQNAIGRYFGPSDSLANAYQIVGIVRDAKYVNPSAKPQPMYFVPLLQRLHQLGAGRDAQQTHGLFINALVLQFKTPQGHVDALVRRTLEEINPNLTVTDLHSFDYQVNGNFTQNRLLSRLATLFGILALILAAVGLYGITSYQVARRTSEIGVRMALGATRRDVVWMVLRGAFRQVGLGIAIGLPIAILSAHSVASQFYGVSAYDPVSLSLSVAALLVAAAAASILPARRAASIEPITALRIQ